MIPPMEEVTSTLISHRGFDPTNNRLYIRFLPSKNNSIGALYSYGNVSEELYQRGCEYINPLNQRVSFGSWFQKFIKADPATFPYYRVEDAQAAPAPDTTAQLKESLKTETVDFASGAPTPAATPEEALPEDRDALRTIILVTQEESRAIVIDSPEKYTLAESYASKIARLRDAWKKICEPDITTAHQAHKAALAIYNNYEKPLADDQSRLTGGMLAFKRKEDERRAREANLLREAEQRRIEAETREQAKKLHEADTLDAIDRGEMDLAEVMIQSAPLPMAAPYAPPVNVPSQIQNTGKSYARESWAYEWVDKDGNPTDTPDLSLIPKMYLMVNEKAIAAVVKNSKKLTAIPGVRAYDAGGMSIRKK